jgi:hypothetical protein
MNRTEIREKLSLLETKRARAKDREQRYERDSAQSQPIPATIATKLAVTNGEGPLGNSVSRYFAVWTDTAFRASTAIRGTADGRSNSSRWRCRRFPAHGPSYGAWHSWIERLWWGRKWRNGLQKFGSLKPDVVVLDLSLPDITGIETARLMASADPRVPLILFTIVQTTKGIEDVAKQAGIRAIVPKTEAWDLISTINAAVGQPN